MTQEESPLEKLSKEYAEAKKKVASAVEPIIKGLRAVLNAMSVDEFVDSLDPNAFIGRSHFYGGNVETPIYHFSMKGGYKGNSITVELDYGYKWNDPHHGHDSKLTIKVGTPPSPLAKVHRIIRSPKVKEFGEVLIKKHYGI